MPTFTNGVKVGHPSMCPVLCSGEYRDYTRGYSIIADVNVDLGQTNKSTATISEVLNTMTGEISGPYGPATRWWSDVAGRPPSDYGDIAISTFNISKLSDADLQAVEDALQSSLGQFGRDDALWAALERVSEEILLRGKNRPRLGPIDGADDGGGSAK